MDARDNLMWRYLLAWLPIVAIAVANGVLREAVIRKQAGELRAHQISTLLLILLLGIYIGIVVRRWPPASAGQALGIGLLWVALTLAFEFLFGHYGAGKPWGELLRDYDLTAGRMQDRPPQTSDVRLSPRPGAKEFREHRSEIV